MWGEGKKNVYDSEKILYTFLSFCTKTEHFWNSVWRHWKAPSPCTQHSFHCSPPSSTSQSSSEQQRLQKSVPFSSSGLLQLDRFLKLSFSSLTFGRQANICLLFFTCESVPPCKPRCFQKQILSGLVSQCFAARHHPGWNRDPHLFMTLQFCINLG